MHTLPLTRATLHGHFSRALQPVLRIADGDSVCFSTLDAGWNPQPDFERDPVLDRGHALCGPIYVEGAQPGMTLAVTVGALRPGALGWTAVNKNFMERFGLTRTARLEWQIDADANVAVNQFGHRVTLSPFMGVMGNAPAAEGIHTTTPPRRVGGNIDCKELVAGSTLYLPVEVEGALFSVGDGHALQSDGESSGTAIECPMDVVALTFRVVPDLSLQNPRAQTPAGWLTMGFDEDLNKATDAALNGALDWLMEQHHIERPEAFTLASVLVDLRITQIVNQVRGVHALLRPLMDK